MDMNLLLASIGSLVVGAGGTKGLPYLYNKFKREPGVVLNGIINEVQSVNETIGKLFLPAPVESIITKIIQVVQTGVLGAEQLCNSSQLTDNQRKQKAFDTAINLLKLEGYTPTPEMETAIKDVIEAGVFIMKSSTSSAAITKEPDTISVAPDIKVAAPIQPTSGVGGQATVQQAVDQGIRQILEPIAQQTADQTVKAVVDSAVQSGVNQAATPTPIV